MEQLSFDYSNTTQSELDAALFSMKVVWDASSFHMKLGKLKDDIIPYIAVFMEEAAKKAEEVVRAYTPATSKGSTPIRDLWDMQYSSDGVIHEYTIRNLYPNQDIIWYFEEGTRPHVIRPKEAGGVLHWTDERTGDEIFSKIVRHPGTRAWGMVKKGKEVGQYLIEGYVQDTIKMVKDLTSEVIAKV